MPDQPTSRYDSSIKVKQEVINRIKNMGMSAAIGAANSGKENAEFVEGAKRMYGTNRVGAQNPANLQRAQNVAAANPLARRAPTIDKGDSGGGGKSVPMPASAPAAATRRTEDKPSTAEKVLGKPNAEAVNKATTAYSNTASDVQRKLGGSPSFGESNAGTESMKAIKGIGHFIRSMYRKQTSGKGLHG